MNKEEKITIVENSFRSGTSHSRCQCACGKEFYNSNGGWDWEDGELDGLKKTNAVDLDYTVDTIFLEGREYCLDCGCWHKRALMIFDFLISHNSQIIELFKLFKQHKQNEVDNIETGDGARNELLL